MLAMVNVAGMGRRARPALAQESPAGETPAEPGPETIGRLGRLGAGAGARRDSTREAYEQDDFVGQRPEQALSLCGKYIRRAEEV